MNKKPILSLFLLSIFLISFTSLSLAYSYNYKTYSFGNPDNYGYSRYAPEKQESYKESSSSERIYEYERLEKRDSTYIEKHTIEKPRNYYYSQPIYYGYAPTCGYYRDCDYYSSGYRNRPFLGHWYYDDYSNIYGNDYYYKPDYDYSFGHYNWRY